MSDIRPSRFLDQTVDTCVLEEYYAKIAQLEQRLAQNKADEVKISQDEIGVNKAREDLVKQKRSIQGIQANRRVVVSRLDRVRVQLIRSEKDAVDLVEEERNVKEKCGVKKVDFSFLDISSLWLKMWFYFFNFKIAVRALSKKLKEFSKLMDQLLVQDMEREALQIHLDILRVEIHTAKNQLAEEKEQIVSLKVKEIAYSFIFDVILHFFLL
jgi:hypothetical protein